MTRPNEVFWSGVAVAGLSVIAAALVAAYASGRRRTRRWPREAGAA